MTETIVISGGASGLGLALARAHARRGDVVCILDRQVEAGEAVAADLAGQGTQCHFIACDLTDAAAVDTAVHRIEAAGLSVDRLYNNAGIAGGISTVARSDDANWESVFALNCFAAVRLTRALLPLMQASRRGRIVNIASMAGLLSASHMGPYSASKAALISLSETLRKELAGTGIRVSVACPAFFQTALAESIPASQTRARASVEKLMRRGRLSADQVAGRVIAAADRGRFYCLPHRRERWLWYLGRLSPGALHRVMLTQQ